MRKLYGISQQLIDDYFFYTYNIYYIPTRLFSTMNYFITK